MPDHRLSEGKRGSHATEHPVSAHDLLLTLTVILTLTLEEEVGAHCGPLQRHGKPPSAAATATTTTTTTHAANPAGRAWWDQWWSRCAPRPTSTTTAATTSTPPSPTDVATTCRSARDRH